MNPICPVCRRPFAGQVWHNHQCEPVFVHRILEVEHGRTLVEGCVLSESLLTERGQTLDALGDILTGE